MRNLKKQFFGYSPDEVDNFFLELAQEKKMIIDDKKQALLDEIVQIEKTLEKYKHEEWKMMEFFNQQSAVNEMIVQEAKKRKQEIERAALDELRAKEECLARLKKMLLKVCEKLQQIKDELQEANNVQRESSIMAKEAQ